MSENDLLGNQVYDEIYNAIEPYASYFNGGEGDNIRHSLPVEFLEVIVWLSNSIVLPLFVNYLSPKVSSIINNIVKRPVKATGNPRVNTNPGNSQEDMDSIEISKEEITIIKEEIMGIPGNLWVKNS